MPENRPRAPVPVTEKYPDLLGGFSGEFWAKDGNPSKIEKDFLSMRENDAFLVRKGLAHMNLNGFTYISWSNLLKKYADIKSEANNLAAVSCTGEEDQIKAPDESTKQIGTERKSAGHGAPRPCNLTRIAISDILA